jgi:hypothetical protein
MGTGRAAVTAAVFALCAGAAAAALPPTEPPAMATADALAVRPMLFALRGVSDAATAGPAPVATAAPRRSAGLTGLEVAVLGFGVACTAAGAAMLGAAAAGLRPTRP